MKKPIASDDRDLRDYAKGLNIAITGSLGITKTLFDRQIIKTKEEYIEILNSLSQDIFLTDELFQWAQKE